MSRSAPGTEQGESPTSSVALHLAGDRRALRATFVVAGDFDGAQVGRFEAFTNCLPDDVDAVIVDLSDTRLLDSSGLRSLIRLRERAATLDATFGVLIAKPFQRKLLEVAGLYHHLGVQMVAASDEPDRPVHGHTVDTR